MSPSNSKYETINQLIHKCQWSLNHWFIGARKQWINANFSGTNKRLTIHAEWHFSICAVNANDCHQLYCFSRVSTCVTIQLIEGSLEVKLPTIWTDYYKSMRLKKFKTQKEQGGKTRLSNQLTPRQLWHRASFLLFKPRWGNESSIEFNETYSKLNWTTISWGSDVWWELQHMSCFRIKYENQQWCCESK